MSHIQHLTILGGGPAGLAAAYFAKKRQIPFTVYEADQAIGGICRTIAFKNFLFDTGAHRFHDRDDAITQEIISLMGSEISRIHVPSQIYMDGRYIDFPLSPLNLIKGLGLLDYAKSIIDILRSRTGGKPHESNMEALSVYKYGRTIAERFLLNYSEKLWGRPCWELSVEIAGNRMKGLDLATFIKEAFFNSHIKTEHIDGAFYYPKKGYGAIVERLGDISGREHLHLNSRITKIFHDNKRITGGEVNGSRRFDVTDLITTIPLNRFVSMMDSPPPETVIKAARGFAFRNVILVALFLNKTSVSGNGSVYIPAPDIPFNRVYEPRNRSALMSPPGKSSLIAEVACTSGDEIDRMDDENIVGFVLPHLLKMGWFDKSEIIDQCVVRLTDAYPVLTVETAEKLKNVNAYLDSFENLKVSGRNGKFMYTHLHDQLRSGKDVIDSYSL